MTITHLDCGTFHPAGSFGGRFVPTALVSHCLLVERPQGLLLVDAGLGSADRADPGRLGRPFVAMMRPDLDPQRTAAAQVTALGYAVDDVTDIALTHLDLDHVGGIGDFPRARVHVLEQELAAATHPTLTERSRYVRAQWAHTPRWQRHTAGGDTWYGFDAVTVLGDDVLLVPLHGHTRGHCGVAVRRPDGGWLLHAGDAYFSAGEKQTPPSAPAGLRAFQAAVQVDGRTRRANQERLRELHAAHGDEVTVFSAHDPEEFAALAGRRA